MFTKRQVTTKFTITPGKWLWVATMIGMLMLAGCSTFRAYFSGVTFREDQLQRLEVAAKGAGYSVKERKPGFLSITTSNGPIRFADHNGQLVASCDTSDRAKCDDVVFSLMRQANIPTGSGRWAQS